MGKFLEAKEALVRTMIKQREKKSQERKNVEFEKRERKRKLEKIPTEKIIKDCEESIRASTEYGERTTSVNLSECWYNFPTTDELYEKCEKFIIPLLQKRGYTAECKIETTHHEAHEETDWHAYQPAHDSHQVVIKIKW